MKMFIYRLDKNNFIRTDTFDTFAIKYLTSFLLVAYNAVISYIVVKFICFIRQIIQYNCLWFH